MSKPDPAGGSLENILASIRKSLAEQPADALGEDQAAAPADGQPDGEPALARKDGLAQRLAIADAIEADQAHLREDDLSDLLEDHEDQPLDAVPASPASAPDMPRPASPQPADKDPLWFLSRRPEAEAPKSEEPAAAAAVEQAETRAQAAADPKLMRPETLRAARPPFFGSSAEGGRPETVMSPDPIAPGVGIMPPPRAELETAPPMPPAAPAPAQPRVAAPAQAAPRAAAPVMSPAAVPAAASSREAAPKQPGARAAGPVMAREAPPAVQATGAGLRAPAATVAITASNDKPKPAAGERVAPSANAAPAGATPNTRALEAMVVELLQPMLRQWLDQNMPRLVAAALKDEADRVGAAERDANKT